MLESLTRRDDFCQEKLGIVDAFPWLKRVLPDSLLGKGPVAREFLQVVEGTLRPCVERHRQELEPDAEPHDYIEALLQEQRRRPDLMSDWHVLMCLADLMVAGNGTTATTLRWAFCFLCSRPDCQRRLQAELDREVGRDRLPSLADRARLPYTEAVIHETQRLGDIVPLLLPHQTMAPVTIGGYRIPAGVQVIANARAVHFSDKLFPEARQFRPERFLDGSGRFRPDKNVMPFSVGRRQCLGESMARAELFLFLTVVLQSFTLRWPEGFQHDLSGDPEPALLINPAPYRLIPERR